MEVKEKNSIADTDPMDGKGIRTSSSCWHVSTPTKDAVVEHSVMTWPRIAGKDCISNHAALGGGLQQTALAAAVCLAMPATAALQDGRAAVGRAPVQCLGPRYYTLARINDCLGSSSILAHNVHPLSALRTFIPHTAPRQCRRVLGRSLTD